MVYDARGVRQKHRAVQVGWICCVSGAGGVCICVHGYSLRDLRQGSSA